MTGQKPDGVAANGFIHLINSGATALDGTGACVDEQGDHVMKPFWKMTEEDIRECLDVTDWCRADYEYFRGGGYSSHFRCIAQMPVTMLRLNIIEGIGPVLQIAEGWTAKLPEVIHHAIDKRTDPTWPTTWFCPRLTGEGAFTDVYSVMANWGANHGVTVYGHVGADLITLSSMLRIPVTMHNVDRDKIYRPHAWSSFGTQDTQAADYAACRQYKITGIRERNPMGNCLKVGILGAGNIAGSMAEALNELQKEGKACAYAVASRSQEKALEFARKWNITRAYSSYEELASDPEVDLIYIATPHSLHYVQAKLCMEHGKNVLVEKAFTANARQAEELFAMAEEKKVFITEAIWTRYMPSREIITGLLREGVIGTPQILEAEFSVQNYENPRMHDPMLCGGALLDLGVYVLTTASMYFGDHIVKTQSSCEKYPT